jgi:hypothetical protein
LHLILTQATQVFLIESIFVQESPQHIGESGKAKFVFAVDLLTTLGQMAL